MIIVGSPIARRGKLVLLPVAAHQVPAEIHNDDDEQRIASHVGRESDKVSRSIVRQEHLRADGVARGPGDKVHCHYDGLFGLAADVAGEHAHGECLCGPEGQHDVVAEEQTDLCRGVFVDDGHQDGGSDEGSFSVVSNFHIHTRLKGSEKDRLRNDIDAHDKQILLVLLHQPGRAE